MTSKISFSNLVRRECKLLNWLFAISALVCALVMPFYTWLILNVRSTENIKYEYDWNLQEVFGILTGFDQPELGILVLAAGVACALAAFSYLHSTVKIDFYHSLAIRREQLFAVKMVSSVIVFWVPFVICQILCFVIGLFYGAASWTALAELLAATLLYFLYFMVSYAGTLLAIMLTAKMVTTFFALLTLAGYVPLILLIVLALQELFWPNTLNNFNSLIESLLNYSSPWAFCMAGFSEEAGGRMGMTGRWPLPEYLCQLVAVAVILLLICIGLYRIRRSESVGKALAFGRTEPVIKILLTVLAALAGGIFANLMELNLVGEVVFLILAGALACMVMEFIYRADIRQALAHKSHILVTIVLAAGIFFFMKYDMTGYNAYIPDRDEVVAMSVRDNLLQIQYDLGNGYPKAYQTTLNQELLDYMETEQVDQLYELAAEGAAYAKSDRLGWAEGKIWAGVKYRLNSGKEIYRTYWIDETKYLAAMDELIKDSDFRQKVFPILTWDEKLVRSLTAEVYLSDAQSGLLYAMSQSEEHDDKDALEARAARLSDEEREEIQNKIYEETLSSQTLWQVVQAYQKDLQKLSYNEIAEAYGELNFGRSEKTGCYYGGYPLDEQFEETMQVLADIFWKK